MIWWQFLVAHPLASGAILIAIPMALDWLLHVIAASIPAARYGVYAGRTVTALDRAGWFVVAALVVCVMAVVAIIV